MWKREDDTLKHLFSPALHTTLGVVCLILAFVALGIEKEQVDHVVASEVDIFEYFTNTCSRSVLSPSPHRISRVPADGNCHLCDVLGKVEGPLYARALCVRCPTCTEGYRVLLGAGATYRTCAAAPFVEYVSGACLLESQLSPLKYLEDLQYVLPMCQPSGTFERLKAAFRAVYVDGTGTVQPSSPSLTSLTNFSTICGDRLSSSMCYWVEGTLHQDQVQHGHIGLLTFVEGMIDTASSNVDSVQYNGHRPRNAERYDFSPVGWLFLRQVGASAMRFGQFVYPQVSSTSFDLAKRRQWTLTFWLKASKDTRGFAFALTDFWNDSNQFPISRRAESSLLLGGDPLDGWSMYYGVYVSYGQLRFVFTQRNGEAHPVVRTLVWEAADIVPFDLFGGQWHLVALVFDQIGVYDTVQLFVDGLSSFVDKGWTRCFPQGVSLSQVQLQVSRPLVFDNATSEVMDGGMLIVGDFNGGLHDITVHTKALSAEEIVRLGAEGMEDNASLNVTANLSVLGLLATALVLLIGITAFRLFSREEVRKVTADDLKRQGKTSASESYDKTEQVGQMVLWKQFAQNTLDATQTMSLHFLAWSWPESFRVSMSWLRFLTFDFTLPFAQPVVWPCVAAVVTVVCLVLLIVAVYAERAKFSRVVENREALPEISDVAPPLALLMTARTEQGVVVTTPVTPILEKALEQTNEDGTTTAESELFGHMVTSSTVREPQWKFFSVRKDGTVYALVEDATITTGQCLAEKRSLLNDEKVARRSVEEQEQEGETQIVEEAFKVHEERQAAFHEAIAARRAQVAELRAERKRELARRQAEREQREAEEAMAARNVAFERFLRDLQQRREVTAKKFKAQREAALETFNANKSATQQRRDAAALQLQEMRASHAESTGRVDTSIKKIDEQKASTLAKLQAELQEAQGKSHSSEAFWAPKPESQGTRAIQLRIMEAKVQYERELDELNARRSSQTTKFLQEKTLLEVEVTAQDVILLRHKATFEQSVILIDEAERRAMAAHDKEELHLAQRRRSSILQVQIPEVSITATDDPSPNARSARSRSLALEGTQDSLTLEASEQSSPFFSNPLQVPQRGRALSITPTEVEALPVSSLLYNQVHDMICADSDVLLEEMSRVCTRG